MSDIHGQNEGLFLRTANNAVSLVFGCGGCLVGLWLFIILIGVLFGD